MLAIITASAVLGVVAIVTSVVLFALRLGDGSEACGLIVAGTPLVANYMSVQSVWLVPVALAGGYYCYYMLHAASVAKDRGLREQLAPGSRVRLTKGDHAGRRGTVEGVKNTWFAVALDGSSERTYALIADLERE